MMKKLFTLLLALVMALSLAACGGNDTPDASGSSGSGTSHQQEQPGNNGDGNNKEEKPDSDEWPLKDVPEWPGTEGVRWFHGNEENEFEISAQGNDDDLQTWIALLKDAGFVGYENAAKIHYIGNECSIYASAKDVGFRITITTEQEFTFGLPEELKGLFPEYVGDGTVVFMYAEEFYGDEDYEGTLGYYFNIYDETEEGSKEYLNALENAGFVNQYPDSKGNTGGEGHYFKEADGKRLGYQVSEYWSDGGNFAEIILTIYEG